MSLLDLRVSLFIVLPMLVLAAHTPRPRTLLAASSILAIYFFAGVCRRQGFADRVEERMQTTVAQL